MRIELGFEIRVLLISFLISSVLIIIGILSSDLGVLGNSLILSTFVVATPQFFLRFEKYRALKEMEERLPIFLRDIVESLRSGMSFHQAIVGCSKVEYGKLSPEIKKMANQISWGMPIDKVIDQFIQRTKKSKRINSAMKIIRESYFSGGDIISIIESIAEAAVMLDETEKERRSLLRQYVVLMYAICFLFLGVVVAINRLMVPIFQVAAMPGASEAVGISNPCENCVGASCSICSIFYSTCNIFAIEKETIKCYYTSLFFFMSIVQAFCCGLVAGEISENSLVSGIKHSIIMLILVFGAFSIVVRLGVMGV
ncbi:MAG: type II secretion system F family protein [Candidatus Aenigmatarchaeota archaeon]